MPVSEAEKKAEQTIKKTIGQKKALNMGVVQSVKAYV
jgi:hypothetical protein